MQPLPTKRKENDLSLNLHVVNHSWSKSARIYEIHSILPCLHALPSYCWTLCTNRASAGSSCSLWPYEQCSCSHELLQCWVADPLPVCHLRLLPRLASPWPPNALTGRPQQS